MSEPRLTDIIGSMPGLSQAHSDGALVSDLAAVIARHHRKRCGDLRTELGCEDLALLMVQMVRERDRE